MAASFSDFDRFSLPGEEPGKTIFRSPISGPAVILIHELPGMTSECQRRGEWLVDQGFTVYMPLLFGEPGENYGMKPMFWPCVRKEFHLWGRDRTSPIVDFLRKLARYAKSECPGSGVGAIGMCLTGGFGLAMMVEPDVRAPVVCQPSIPNAFFPVSQVGMSEKDFESACERCVADGIDVLGFRFEKDPICRRQRFSKLAQRLGDRFEPHVVGADGRSTKKGHAVLTDDFYNNKEFHDEEKREIEAKLVAHLNRYLSE